MRSTERIVIYVGLLAAVLLGLGAREGAAARATPVGAPLDTPVRLATVNVYSIAEAMMRLPELSAARDEVAKQFNTKLDTIRNDMMQMRAQLQGMQQTDPKARDLYAAYQRKEQEGQTEGRNGTRALEVMNAKQYAECYDKILAAADALAEKGGYTHVINSRAREVKVVDQNNPASLYQEVLARPIVRGPAADDLTDEVMAELKLQPAPANTPVFPTTPANPAPAPAPTGG